MRATGVRQKARAVLAGGHGQVFAKGTAHVGLMGEADIQSDAGQGQRRAFDQPACGLKPHFNEVSVGCQADSAGEIAQKAQFVVPIGGGQLFQRQRLLELAGDLFHDSGKGLGRGTLRCIGYRMGDANQRHGRLLKRQQVGLRGEQLTPHISRQGQRTSIAARLHAVSDGR